MKISVFGLGYVGTVASACLARDGHTVVGVDPNRTKVSLINGGNSPIIEAQISELVSDAVQKKRLTATDDAAAAVAATDMSLVCVGTPSNDNGSLNVDYVRRVCRDIGSALPSCGHRHTIAIRSTLLPGSMADCVIPELEESSGLVAGKDFGVCNNPEFLREGTAVFDYDNPPKTVIGETDEESGDLLMSLYEHLDAPVIRTSVQSAEMLKYVDNVWHALKISFANEIGTIAKNVGLDGTEIMDMFCRDEKLNISRAYLKPGFAFGGSCLPKDVRALTYKARSIDVEVPLLDKILDSNNTQILRALSMIRGKDVRRIGVLGFSFKAGTDDLRESPVVELIEQLIGKGYDLSLYDRNVHIASLVGANRNFILNHVPHIAKLMKDRIEDVLKQSELVVVGNNDPEFLSVLRGADSSIPIIDLGGICRPLMESHENYEGICW